jgi:hypothetical protein
MHLGLWTCPEMMPSLIRLSRFQSAPGEAHFKALQNVLFVQENPERCIMYHRSPASVARLNLNLEGHTNHVSSISADFIIDCSVAAVVDDSVATSHEPDGATLTFSPVNIPSITSIIAASESGTILDEVETTKSANPMTGFGPL